MGFLKGLLGRSVANGFHKDLARAAKMSKSAQYFLAELLIERHEATQKALKSFSPEKFSQYLYLEANKAKEQRHQAIEIGAKSEEDLYWFAPAMAESYFNAIKIADASGVRQIVEKMGTWIDQAYGFFDEDVATMLNSAPQCTANLIVVCEKYNKNYKCIVTQPVADVHKLVENILRNDGGGFVGYESRVASKAFEIWLDSADPQDFRASYIPKNFYSLFSSHLHALAEKDEAIVYCPECGGIVENPEMVESSRESNALHSSWHSEWTCPSGHTLYAEDHEILWNRKPTTQNADSSVGLTMESVVKDSSIAAVLTSGKYSAVYVELTKEAHANFLKENIKSKEALSVLVKSVERRIKTGDIEDPSCDFEALGLSRSGPSLGDVPRLVISPTRDVICNWSKNS